MAKLVCQAGPKAGHEYPLAKDRVVFGRQKECDVQIPDGKASREHFVIQRYGQLFALVDLKSRNGTRLNGNKMSERILDFGDRIRVGESEYQFTREDGDADIGEMLTKYELENKIGEGGMGVVYKARQRSMDRTIALKILSPKHASKQRSIDLFIKEARAAGSLNHPNIIQVHDVGTENDLHFFSMELVDGATCTEILKENGQLDLNTVLEIGRQTARALEYAHSQNIIHRDIKPDNIMINSDNVVKVADLGISKTVDELENTENKSVVGTPHYMAPEVATGSKIDHRSDLYSLGSTLFQLLSGKYPYTGKSASDIIRSHVKDSIPELPADVPKDIAEFVYTLMAKDADNRPQDAGVVAARMEDLLEKHNSKAGKAGGETIMLQRLSNGNGTGSSSTRPRAGTTGPNKAVTGTATIDEPQGGIPLKAILLGAGALILIAIVVMNMPQEEVNNPGSQNTPPLVDTPVKTPAVTKKTTSTKPEPSSAAVSQKSRERAQVKQVRALASALSLASSRSDIQSIQDDAAAMSNRELEPVARQQLDSILKQLSIKTQSFQYEKAEKAFEPLSTEARTLSGKKSFNEAIEILDTYIQQYGDNASRRARTLKADIESRRKSYITNLQREVADMSKRGDGKGLRTLRKNLPPSMLNTDISKSINRALSGLAGNEQEGQQVIVDNIARSIAAWHFDEALALYEAQNAAVSKGTPLRETVDNFQVLAQRWKKLITEIDTGLKPKQRFFGRLRNGILKDPYLFEATEEGVRAKYKEGSVIVPWAEFEIDQLRDLAKKNSSMNVKELFALIDERIDIEVYVKNLNEEE